MKEKLLNSYSHFVESLSEDDMIARDLYLRGLQTGKIYGPETGIPNIDKPWLKNFTDNEIKTPLVKKTCYQYLYDENCNYKDDVVISFMNKKITYGKLFDEIEKVAKSLKSLNVKKGDTVTVCLPNTPESAYFFYACSKIGAIADFIDPRELEIGLDAYLNISKPKYLVMMDTCFNNFKNLIDKKNIENVIITSPIESLSTPVKKLIGLKEKLSNYTKAKEQAETIKKSKACFMSYEDFIKVGINYKFKTEEEYEPDTPVAIAHTGGSTGIPKGVLLSNDNLNALTTQIKSSEKLSFKRHKKLLGVMPEFVGYGLSVGLHTSFVCGMETKMILKYEPEKIPAMILKYKPNAMAGSPAHWEIFSSSPLINKKTDLSFFDDPIEGGDQLNIKVEKKVNDILLDHGCKSKIKKGYGLTEKCSAVSVCFDNDVNELGSAGIPFSKTTVGIYDNEKEKYLGYDEVGEIIVRGKDVMLEYYNNIEETKQTIRKHPDEVSWLHTGDLGYVNEEGRLFAIGRLKNVIIRNDGKKVYPEVVEKTMLKSPLVKAIAIVGAPDPYYYNGEIPVAYVEKVSDVSESQLEKVSDVSESQLEKVSDVSESQLEKEINNYATASLADYQVPLSYCFIDHLPKTKVGKIDRTLLKKLAKEEPKSLVLKR